MYSYPAIYLSYSKLAPYEGRRSATLINKVMSTEPSSLMTKPWQPLIVNGNNYLYKHFLQNQQFSCNFLIIQSSFKQYETICTFYLIQFLKLILKMKMAYHRPKHEVLLNKNRIKLCYADIKPCVLIKHNWFMFISKHIHCFRKVDKNVIHD
jgi:hypothetical protein